MTTLKQTREKHGSCYTSPATGVPLYTRRDIDDWLKQKRTKYPRLNNYPDYATKIELIEYVDVLTDWCSDREKYTELLEEKE